MGKQYAQGILLTFVLAILAKQISGYPFFNIMGQLVIAILLGMIWRAIMGYQETTTLGIQFSSKKLLRLGIILLGMRLNFMEIVEAGASVFWLAVFVIIFALSTVYFLGRLLHVDKKLSMLTACGTAICGAAAVVAVAPQIKANDKEIAVGTAVVAILGTLFTVMYTFCQPFLGLSPTGYGIFSGATLHEIAHVLAAAAPGGETVVNSAVVVKLTRVALLVPVVILLGFWAQKAFGETENKRSWKTLPIPWFILGFLAMSGLNTLQLLPASSTKLVVDSAYLLMGMAMAGLGLQIDLHTFKEMGKKPLLAGLIGSIFLSVAGFLYVTLLALQ